jgi:hypothetical protein
MNDVLSIHKWNAHDQFKPENQGKKKSVEASKLAVESTEHQRVKKYPDVEAIQWSKDCPSTYVRGKLFLPNQIMEKMPYGMRRFHDWYLRVVRTKLHVIQATVPTGTFGSPATFIAFDFDDAQTWFHLKSMEMNLIRMWCL